MGDELNENENFTGSVHFVNGSYVDFSRGQRVAFFVGYSFIMLFSLTGNSLVLAAVYRNTNHRMRTVSNYFVVNMSSSDLLITVCNIPKAISSVVLHGTWPIAGTKGLHLCRMTKLLWFSSIDVSLLSLIAISANRFLLVFFPLKRFVTPKVAFIIIVLIWLIALIFAGSLMPGVEIYIHMGDPPERFCSLKFSQDMAIGIYLIVHFAVFIVWPLLTMVVLYSAIIFKLWCRAPPGNRSVASQDFNDRLNKKVLLMLITVVLLFSVCWVPFWVTTLPHMTFLKSKMTYFYITECVAYANCALNPIVYATFNEGFRNAFKEILRPFFSHTCLGAQQLSAHNRVFVLTLRPLTNNNNLKTNTSTMANSSVLTTN